VVRRLHLTVERKQSAWEIGVLENGPVPMASHLRVRPPAGGASTGIVSSTGGSSERRTRWGEPAYLNDGDHESPLDPDKDHKEDEDTDSRFHENSRYHDADDSGVVTYGQSADAIDIQRVRTAIKRYYAMGSAGDGNAACADLVPHLAKSIPVDYGRFGPSYLRGASTCGAVLTRLFERSRSDFPIPVEVTDVRVNGNEGVALLGFTTMPAGYIAIEREQGAWWVAEMLPHKLA
jgi:hypothetical protein